MPAMAQELPRGDLRYMPDPAWFRGPGGVLPDGEGRVRLVSAPEGRAALTLDQYDRYVRVYRRALARLSFRMPVARAEPLARSEALRAILALYEATPVPDLPVQEITAPDVPVRPVR